MERSLRQNVFERTSNITFGPGLILNHSNKALSIDRMAYKDIVLLPCQPQYGKISINYHSQEKRRVVPIDFELFNYLIKTPDFLDYLLEKSGNFKKGKEIMILCTGSTLVDGNLHFKMYLKHTVGTAEAELGYIWKRYEGSLGVKVYELAYLKPQMQKVQRSNAA
jgi:hypothetical protein